jgi:hypothetical protein
MIQYNPYVSKTAVKGRLAVILRGRNETRRLSLIPQPSRCLKTHDVHEIIICDEEDARPGAEANRIAYLGFFEVSRGGVVIVGDEMYCGGRLMGTVAGFDEAHSPNHINIVLFNKERNTGEELGIKLDQEIVFLQGSVDRE